MIINTNTLKEMQKVHWLPINKNIHSIIMKPFVFLSRIIYPIGQGIGFDIYKNYIGHSGLIPGYATEIFIDRNKSMLFKRNTSAIFSKYKLLFT